MAGLLTPTRGELLLLEAGAKLPAETAAAQVRWTDWRLRVDPRAEWKQMFHDAWLMHRDYFYDSGMHGVDWAAIKRRYEPLVSRLTERDELNDLLAQMVSELGALHSQVRDADLRNGGPPVGSASLGARLKKVTEGFSIEHIYQADPELPDRAGPLAAAGAKAGEIIVAVNGRPSAEVADLSELLRGQAGRQVLLSLKTTAGAERSLVALPVDAATEASMRTGDWEWALAQKTLERSEGRIGYLRLRAMVGTDIATFAREFYSHLHRDGLIIDMRANDGGNIDSWVVAALQRRAWAHWQQRSPETALPFSNQQGSFRGHLVVLTNESTYSDGETFSEAVRRLQLGTLIGTPTAGAGVWLTASNRLLDNGIARVAEFGLFVPGEGWLIEGRGVAPDIEVDNPPRATFEGGDAQLDAAINHLQRLMASRPKPAVVPPPFMRPFAEPKRP